MDTENPGDPSRDSCCDRGVPVVQEVVDPGLGDAGGLRQCPHGERSFGCSLHELAEEFAVGEFEALVRQHVLLGGLSTFVDVDS